MKELEELKSLLDKSRLYFNGITDRAKKQDELNKWRRYIHVLEADYESKLESEVVKYLNTVINEQNG
jgi:hypothetical protein